MSTNVPDRIQERRAAFRLACASAQLAVSTYVEGMPADVRDRNPFVMVAVDPDAPAPPDFVSPPGVDPITSGVGVGLGLVYAAELVDALATLPISENLRGKVLQCAEAHGAILAIGRLPYVRVILYDVAGGSCAFARVDDEDGTEAN